MMSEFEREDRYIVVKLKKLTHMQEKHLRACLYGEGIQTVESVVIERDWPEYHLVWAMLEHRMAGKPVPDFNAWRRADELQQLLNVADQRIDELTQPTGEIVWCACGDGHAANSYGAGFLAANNGVCENCEAAGGGFQEPVLIQAVAVTREGDDGMYLEWLLEGGICELDLPDTMLFALPEANDLCDEDGSAEIYTSQPAPVSVVLPERFNNALPFDGSERGYDVGWNGCLDEFARLNTPH